MEESASVALSQQAMSDEQLVKELIGVIYDAACDSSRWQDVLRGVAQLTRSKSAVLIYQDHEVEHASTFAAYGLKPEWLEIYNRQYGATDPALQIISSVPTGQLTASHLTGKQDELYASDAYKEFYRPQDIYHLAGTWLLRSHERSALLGFQRAHNMPEYETDVLNLVNELVPHLQRALHIHKIHTAALIRSEAFAMGLDSLQMGIIFFDHQCNITFCNKAAEALINQHPAIQMRGDTVYAASTEDNNKLRQALASAALANQHDGVEGATAIGLHHPDSYTPLPALISPIRLSNFAAGISMGTVAVVMTISNPEQMTLASPEFLKEIYGLTLAEAEVALHLANSVAPNEIAEKNGVKISTVRSQIASIYNKIGVNSQAQLLKVLLNSPIDTLR